MPSTAQKRAAVEGLLSDPLWAGRSTNWLAEQAGVSWGFADKVRTQWELDHPGPPKREAKTGRFHPASMVARILHRRSRRLM